MKFPFRVALACSLCDFRTSRPLSDFVERGLEGMRVELPCTNCSTELDAYDAGDGNEPAIVTDHRVLRIEPEGAEQVR